MCHRCALWSASFGCVNESGWTCFCSCCSSLCSANTGPKTPPPWILEGWSILPPAHQHQLFPWQAQPWTHSQRNGEGFPCPFLAGLLWLACMAQQKCHVPAQLRAEMGHRLDLQDGLLLKREEIRNQASLTTYNRQISFLNILSDLDCSFQEGNKKYLFCNPTLL